MLPTRWESYIHSYRLESALIDGKAHVRIWQHNERPEFGEPDKMIVEAESYDVIHAQTLALAKLAELLTPMRARES